MPKINKDIKDIKAPKYPRIKVKPEMHIRLQKAAIQAKISLTELADGIFTDALK